MVEELKAKAYDMEKLYEEYKQKMDAIIKEAEEKSNAIGETPKEEVEEESIQIPAPVVEDVQPVEEEVVAPIQEETTTEEVAIENVEQPVEEVVAPVQEEVTTEEVAVENVEQPVQEESIAAPAAPIIENSEIVIPQVENAEESVQDTISAPQPLNETPLAPVGLETENIVAKEEPKKVYNKVDMLQESKCISTTKEQYKKLKASKKAQKDIALGQVSQTKEEIKSQIDAMTAELMTTTDEARANELNEGLKLLNKKYEVA